MQRGYWGRVEAAEYVDTRGLRMKGVVLLWRIRRHGVGAHFHV